MQYPDLYVRVLRDLRSGKTIKEASEALGDLVQACRETGKLGEITIKLKIKPDRGDTGQYFIEDQITTKVPEHPRGQTIMFGSPDNNLTRTDPRQQELELKSVDNNHTDELKTLGGQ